tara:strand:+ start:876 stop:2432 length:1557 start_codon:yes stop_codon:yes gene_type:complete
MANPNIPNLCGANPNLNDSLSKIEELKDKLLSNIDVDASTLKSELEEGLDELTSAFDKLEAKLPEAPAVNFQAEVTSLINDINKTTAAGITAFNAKLASLKLDFGNTLEEKGIDFDSLIASAETKLAGGGNVCDTVNNLEIPAANSGTGITTETKEERGTGTSITLTDTPKSIVSVFGKRSGEGFFGSANYKQSGRTITTTESFEIIRVRYIVDLIKEKPIAVKQADKDGEKEELSIISKNIKSVEKNAEAKVQALSKQINDKTAAGVSTDDVQKAFDNLFATLESEEFKTQMKSDFESAQTEFDKIAQDPLKYKTITAPQRDTSSVSSTADETTVAQEEKKTRTVKVTTTEDRNTTTQVQTTVETTGGGFTTRTRPKTEKTVLSENGFTSRQSQITERFMIATERENLKEVLSAKAFKRYKDVDSFSKIKLKQKPLKINSVTARQYKSDGSKITVIYIADQDRDLAKAIKPVVLGDTNEIAITKDVARFFRVASISDLNVVTIKYTYLENIDPNFKG